MELNIMKQTKVEAKILKINLKVCDEFNCSLLDQDNDIISSQELDYVPSFMPENHYGDYVILDIDINTGQILNWDKAKIEKYLPAWVEKNQDLED